MYIGIAALETDFTLVSKVKISCVLSFSIGIHLGETCPDSQGDRDMFIAKLFE